VVSSLSYKKWTKRKGYPESLFFTIMFFPFSRKSPYHNLATLRGARDAITSIAFSAHGKLLAAAGTVLHRLFSLHMTNRDATQGQEVSMFGTWKAFRKSRLL
jgi:hypothetical protein